MARQLGAAAHVAADLDTEVRHGTRNYIRQHDIIRFQERPGCQWHRVTFLGAGQDHGGVFYKILLPNGNQRFVRPDRVQRIQRGGGGRDR